MNQLPEIQLCGVANPRSAWKRIADTVLLGHGRFLLRIVQPDGRELRLVCYDVDGPLKHEYDNWSNQ